MPRLAIAFLATVFALRAAAQSELPISTQSEPTTSTTIVPVVGSIIGVSAVRWLTDVEIVNDTGAPTDIAVELSSEPAAPVFFLTLVPGQVQRFTDIVGQAFGLERALSPLRVTSGSRRPISVRANVYAVSGGELSARQPIATYTSDVWFPIRVLDGLAFNDELRTNIGLANLGDTDADFILALQRIPGRNVAITQVRVGAGSLRHVSIQELFPLITQGEGFSLVVESPQRQTFVYASVIRNSDNAAHYIAPRIGNR